MAYKKNNYGFLISYNGDIIKVVNDYIEHYKNNRLTDEIIGIKFYPEEDYLRKQLGNNDFYIFKAVSEFKVIWFSDLGYEDGKYLGIYIPQNIQQITEEQRNKILELKGLITSYPNHELCYVPQLDKYEFGSEKIDVRHNAIFDIIGGMEDVQSFRNREEMAKVLGRK